MTESSDVLRVDDLLPLPLQDLSLLKVVNDVDAYPVDLLASLPRWLRYRLLNNLPALDLCRLDHTPVAKDIDVEELWKTRNTELRTGLNDFAYVSCRGTTDYFDLSIGFNSLQHALSPSESNLANSYFFTLKTEVDSAIRSSTKKERVSARDRFIIWFISDVLSRAHYANTFNSRVTSIDGLKLLKNLTSDHSIPITEKFSSTLWWKQYTCLKVEGTELVPHRLQSDYSEDNPQHLLTILASSRCPRLANVCIHVNSLSQYIRDALYIGKFAKDNGSTISRQSETYRSVMKSILSRVEVLLLKCDKYSNVGVMNDMIQAATSERSECKLRFLFCITPDLYVDIVQPLSNVFTLQNFEELFLELDDTYLLSLSELLRSFMTTPCTTKQRLTIQTNTKLRFSEGVRLADLASLELGGVDVPQCAIEHKELRFSWMGVLHLLLQLPTIHLNKVRIDDSEYLHLCASHPDFSVENLTIGTSETLPFSRLTYQEDFATLLKMPTLREISIHGYWCHEAKVGVILGLQRRSRSAPALRRISLDSHLGGLNSKEYRPLWDAIFSLPELDQFSIELGAKFADVDLIYERWTKIQPKSRLKYLDIRPFLSEVDTSILSQIALDHYARTKGNLRRAN